jgi:hypothetical protein
MAEHCDITVHALNNPQRQQQSGIGHDNLPYNLTSTISLPSPSHIPRHIHSDLYWILQVAANLKPHPSIPCRKQAFAKFAIARLLYPFPRVPVLTVYVYQNMFKACYPLARVAV